VQCFNVPRIALLVHSNSQYNQVPVAYPKAPITPSPLPNPRASRIDIHLHPNLGRATTPPRRLPDSTLWQLPKSSVPHFQTPLPTPLRTTVHTTPHPTYLRNGRPPPLQPHRIRHNHPLRLRKLQPRLPLPRILLLTTHPLQAPNALGPRARRRNQLIAALCQRPDAGFRRIGCERDGV
jgi:hypothetical protein